jgi:hypothetical protein
LATNKHKIFTAADIEKYHKGLLSPKEMHELEKAALEDPFLADALEGYGSVSVNVSSDLAELHRKLEQRVSGSKVVALPPTRNSFKWRTVAAAIVILGGIGFLTFKLSTSEKQNSLAEVNKTKHDEAPAPVVADSNKATTIDRTSIAKNRSETAVVTKVGSANKYVVVSSAKKADTANIAGYSSISGTSAASDVARSKKQDTDSVNEKSEVEARSTAAPSAVKKAESRAAQPAGVLNEDQVARIQSQVNNFNGRVVDVGRNPIPFANITNTRDKHETYADAKGYFSMASPDSILNVRIRSVGFENGVTELKNNAYNQVVLQDDKTAPDKILSFQNSDANKSRETNMQVEQPEPVDGWSNYNRYLANNINVPEDAEFHHDNGQVQLSFDINDDGDPVNVKVDRSLCKKCDAEAVRLVKQGPKWKQKNKKAKRAFLTVPFHIK